MAAIVAFTVGAASDSPRSVALCDYWQSNYRIEDPAAVQAFFAFQSVGPFEVVGNATRRMIVWHAPDFEAHVIQGSDYISTWLAMPDDNATRSRAASAVAFGAIGADASLMTLVRAPEKVPTVVADDDYDCPVETHWAES